MDFQPAFFDKKRWPPSLPSDFSGLLGASRRQFEMMKLLVLLFLPLATAFTAAPLRAHAHVQRRSVLEMGSTKDFKVGLTLEVEGQAWKIMEFLHVKPGKGPAFVRSKLKNLETGAVLDKTWKAGESFPDAQVDKEEMQMSYIDGDDYVFMNLETYEEERIPTSDLGDKTNWIKDEQVLTVLKFKGKPIDVQVPGTMTLKVTEAEPGAKGNTAGGRTERPVTVETGASVNVPMFIEEGEMIRVDTETGKYLGRAND